MVNNLIVEIKDFTGTITVNRPAVLNALNLETVREFASAVKKMDEEKGVRVVVITGAGEKAFVAGADIAAMKKMTPEEAENFAREGHACMNAIGLCSKPVIAMVNGFALGGGTELAIACDIIYASDTAKFGLPEVKLGLYPGFGGTQRLMRLIGAARARELIFSGRIISVTQAYEWGIVNRVFPAGELKNEVAKLAGEISANGPVAISTAKGLMTRGMNLGLDSALKTECAEFSKLFGTKDLTEGLSAFLEKRKPVFSGT